jgi:trk system potassium uptake protein TrkH
MNIKKLSPEFILLLSFFLAIILGAILLYMPFSTIHKIHFIDALFTATSAICVTGLTVLDTGQDFSLTGQIIIIFLIQLGGLGIMTFSVLFLLFLKDKIPFNAKMAIKSSYSEKYFDIKYLIKSIAFTTFFIEGIGTLLLFLYFYSHNFTPFHAFFIAIFHSISAFCNAGFSLFSNSLVDYKFSWYINIIIIGLIIFGGIGFTVLLDIKNRKLSLHSKIVIFVTILLIFMGTLLILLSEYSNSLKGLPLDKKILISFFQSVTPRTAGFNTVELNKFNDFSLLIIILLMFVGASPGSCGGGVKTTTFTIFLMTLFSTIRGRDYINIFNRTISKEIIFKSFTIILVALSILLMGILSLSIFDSTPMNRGDFLSSVFEVFSALGTVGLSIGYTKQLTFGGKIVIILLMYIGRVGPLTLLLGLRYRSKRHMIQYAEENVLIG